MRSAASTFRRHHYELYYYNYHHFRWKKHQVLRFSEEAPGIAETHKTPPKCNHAYYKLTTNTTTGERKHARLRSCKRQETTASIMTFASFILMISTFLLLTSYRAVDCQEKLTVTEALDFKDSPRQASRSVDIKNCFSLERKKSWPRAIVYNNSTASVNIDLSKVDQSVLECLNGQSRDRLNIFYKISIVLKHKKERILMNTSGSSLILSASQLWHKSTVVQKKSSSGVKTPYYHKGVNDKFSLHTSTITFPYVLFRGVYRIQFHVCDEKSTQAENYENDRDIRNKKIGDLGEQYDSIVSHDSDQNYSSNINNIISKNKGNLSMNSLEEEASDSIVMPKETCLTNEFIETAESKNIYIGKDFIFRNWCKFSKINDLAYFSINSSQHSASIMSNDTTINSNDSFSSDNIIIQSHKEEEDQSTISISSPVVFSKNASIKFEFSFNPCHEAFPYETATVELYSVAASPVLLSHRDTQISGFNINSTNDNMEQSDRKESIFAMRRMSDLPCGISLEGNELKPVKVYKFVTVSKNNGRSEITLFTPKLKSGSNYCAIAKSNHVLCSNAMIAGLKRQDEELVSGEVLSLQVPQFCSPMSSNWSLIVSRTEDLPFIATYIPFCTTHFRCGWLYILVVGSVAFVTSCLLAVCFVYCCCRTKRQHIAVPLKQEDAQTFDTICLNDPENVNQNQDGVDGGTMPVLPQKTWTEMHDEFYAEPPKNPGKILLLYSPDTKQFKELQKAFRNFLEMACHCVVLDLFDEALFQTICYDPEKWLANLLKDRHFKIIVVSSEGAFKRQQAIINGEVLNIQKYDNSELDGLFSAGLRFIQQNHAYDHRRLTLVRYETLALTKPEYKLTMMTSLDTIGSNRISKTEVDEYIVTSQLPELFCWIHDIPDGRDYRLVGRPWDKYHLELQLLKDELKSARQERRATIIK